MTGQLCKGCKGRCQNEFKTEKILLPCPSCEATGCPSCEGGFVSVDKCPNEYIGQEMIENISIASMDELPIAGGLLDQSAWFISLRQTMQNEKVAMQNEMLKQKRGSKH